ncbi:hypothetical protein GCM10023178_67250 [Actinomadura luteofluorescens]
MARIRWVRHHRRLQCGDRYTETLEPAPAPRRNPPRDDPVSRGGPCGRSGRWCQDPGTALACLQWANHEVGTLQPVEEVAQACRAAGVPLFVDAAQSLGRAEVPGGWSYLAGSAHKWGGPAGVGVLAVRKGTR